MYPGSVPGTSRARGAAGERLHGLQLSAVRCSRISEGGVQRSEEKREERRAAAAGRKRGGGLGFGARLGALVGAREQVAEGPPRWRAVPRLCFRRRRGNEDEGWGPPVRERREELGRAVRCRALRAARVGRRRLGRPIGWPGCLPARVFPFFFVLFLF